jgi:hypothetical protein
MNVELTIQTMFDNYPTLFKERSDCLNQLFCTIGNGYEWYNGELVSDIDAFPDDVRAVIENRLVNGKAFQHNKMSLRAEALEYYRRRLEKDTEKDTPINRKLDEEYFNSIPDDVYYKHPRKKRWYFYINIPNRERIDYFKDCAFLWNYPEDIKPDWLAAIEECKTLLREDGFEV